MDTEATGNQPVPHAAHRHGVLYPNHYCWFLLLSALDIMLTHKILNEFRHMGGRELNTFADFLIARAGLWGAIGLKCASVVVVVAILEFVGRRRPTLGRTLMNCVLAMAIVPVSFALVQLAWIAVGD
jgi:hypothetical protein